MHFIMHSNQQGPRDSSNVPTKSAVAPHMDSRGPWTRAVFIQSWPRPDHPSLPGLTFLAPPARFQI